MKRAGSQLSARARLRPLRPCTCDARLARVIAALLAWVVVAYPPSARAQVARSRHSIRVDACVPIDAAQFQRRLAIELSAAPDDSWYKAGAPNVSLSCVDVWVLIAIDDAALGRSLSRRVDLRGVDASARMRLLVLAAAELLLANQVEGRSDRPPLTGRESTPPPEPASSGEGARAEAAPALAGPRRSEDVAAELRRQPASERSAEPRSEPTRADAAEARGEPSEPPLAEQAAQAVASGQPAQASAAPADESARGALEPRAQAWRLGAALELSAFSSAFQVIPGLALRLTAPLASRLVLQIGAQAGYRQLDGRLELGARVQSTRVRLLMASLLVALQYTLRHADLEWQLGPGARVGLAHFAAVQPRELSAPNATLRASSGTAPWAGPLLTTSLGYQLSQRVQIAVLLELGYVALQARAVAPGVGVVTALRDVWGAAALAVNGSFAALE